MAQERAIVLIDGSNFYFKLRDLKLHQLLTFDFSSFASSLIGKNRLVSASYYVGKVRTDGCAGYMGYPFQKWISLLKNSFTKLISKKG